MDFNEHVGYTSLGMINEAYVIELDLLPKHMNRYGFAHGGVLFSMLDTAMSRACVDALANDRKSGVTLEIKINYLKKADSGKITAYGQLINQTRRTGYVEGYILNEDGSMVAKATGTMFLTES